MPVPAQDKDTRLPVTLLSGFLGAGKTTLLSNILKSKDHGLRCALIVNDMGALNIDASLVKNHKLTQQGEKIVQMQNGCICCTLRADLLEEIANLAEMDAFDYLLIESSGISEPIQVAETFTSEFADTLADASVDEIYADLPADSSSSESGRKRLAELIKAGGLSKVARLDTCVSVVDCTTILEDFDTTDFLTDRLAKDVDPEDERNITDLLTDQIEFANVILLNKVDAVKKEVVNKAESLVRTLNPEARVFRTSYSKVPLDQLLNTRLFDFDKASVGAGWLQSLREAGEYTDSLGNSKWIPKPETEEYGISSFVYSARRPFHPERLWELMQQPFCILQNGVDEGEEAESEDGEGIDVGEDDALMGEGREEILARLQAEKATLDLPSRIAFKRASPIWRGVLRSKGFVWLATRPDISGEWSQAGCMWTLSGGAPWMCVVPEDEWPTEDEEVKGLIRKDFSGLWGDRRQEIVFIGQGIDKDLLTATLNEVLLTDKEWTKWERIMNSRRTDVKKVETLCTLFNDGWEDWPNPIPDDHPGHPGDAVQDHTGEKDNSGIASEGKPMGAGGGHSHAHPHPHKRPRERDSNLAEQKPEQPDHLRRSARGRGGRGSGRRTE